MREPDSYSYPRYLQAKRTVDDRALNRNVWTHFVDLLAESSPDAQILEVGGGVGATFERVSKALEDRDFSTLEYIIVDRESANIQAAREHIQAWGRDNGYSVRSSRDEIYLSSNALDVHLRLITEDLFVYANQQQSDSFDAVIAQAVLDLLNLQNFFSSLRPHLRSGGLWYLPIHFDGVTGFEPIVDRELDPLIEKLYHQSMTDEADESGSRAHTGRRLLTAFNDLDDNLVAAGSSDWIVFPRNGKYPKEERYFLHHILHFIETELSGHSRLNQTEFRDWIEERRNQTDAGELVYIAHQIDVLAQKT